MAEQNASEALDPGVRIYVDSSALAKLYVPEAESDAVDDLLRRARDLVISDLAVTEVLSAVARRYREKALGLEQVNQIRAAVLADAGSGSFDCLGLSPAIHRRAEQLLLTVGAVALRTLDGLHIALALSCAATHVLTFDRRMREAAMQAGLNVIDL
ncbi:MAG: type II toxin-antitoxin system VapC family toxin [Steroidobacteraceae bacterium]